MKQHYSLIESYTPIHFILRRKENSLTAQDEHKILTYNSIPDFAAREQLRGKSGDEHPEEVVGAEESL